MTTDVEIAQQFTPRPINEISEISEISEKLGIDREHLHPYGRDIAKIGLKALNTKTKKKDRLILVSATTPTPSGEGKTTTTIGLGQALPN